MGGRQRRRQVTEFPFELRVPFGGVVNSLLHAGERGLPVHRRLAHAHRSGSQARPNSRQGSASRLEVRAIRADALSKATTLRGRLIHLVAQLTRRNLSPARRILISGVSVRRPPCRRLNVTLGLSHSLLGGSNPRGITRPARRLQPLLSHPKTAHRVSGLVLRNPGLLLGSGHLLRRPLRSSGGLLSVLTHLLGGRPQALSGTLSTLRPSLKPGRLKFQSDLYATISHRTPLYCSHEHKHAAPRNQPHPCRTSASRRRHRPCHRHARGRRKRRPGLGLSPRPADGRHRIRSTHPRRPRKVRTAGASPRPRQSPPRTATDRRPA